MNEELFTKTPIHKAYFHFALPVVFGMVVTLIYNMVDTYFIALTGNTELIAGVSLVAPLFTLMIAIGDIWGLGGSSLISRLFGGHSEERAGAVNAFSVWAAIGSGLLLLVILLLFRTPILGLLGATPETLPYAGDYYFYIALGAPFIILTLVPNNTLRTEGLAGTAMIGSIAGSVANMILDPIFIFLLGMGAGGAAIATVLGNILTNVIFFHAMKHKSRFLAYSPRKAKCSGEELRDILSIGIPASITNLMGSFAMLLTNRFLLPYGAEQIAAFGIASKVNLIAVLIIVGFAFGAQPLIGFNYGAGNGKRLREVLRFGFLFTAGLGLILTLVLGGGATAILGLFSAERTLVESGARILRMLLLGMPFMAVVTTATGAFQAMGKAFPAFLLSLSRQGILLLLCMLAGSAILGYNGILAAQPAADLLCALLAVVLLIHALGSVQKKSQKNA